MNWNSPAEFFNMGGYALYVWGSFGACALLMIAEPLFVAQRRKAIVKLLQRKALAESETQE
jgi:heme exporter protein D